MGQFDVRQLFGERRGSWRLISLAAVALIMACGQTPSFNENGANSRRSSSDDPSQSTADQGLPVEDATAASDGTTDPDAIAGGDTSMTPDDQTAEDGKTPPGQGEGKDPGSKDPGDKGQSDGKDPGKGGDKDPGKGGDKNPGDKDPGMGGGKDPGDKVVDNKPPQGGQPGGGGNTMPPPSGGGTKPPPKNPDTAPVVGVRTEAAGVDGTVLLCLDFSVGAFTVRDVGNSDWYAANFLVTVDTADGPAMRRWTPKVNTPYQLTGKWNDVCDARPVVTVLKPKQKAGRDNPPTWWNTPRLNRGTQRCFAVDDGDNGRPGPVALTYHWELTRCGQ